jgi:hypothetical protein
LIFIKEATKMQNLSMKSKMFFWQSNNKPLAQHHDAVSGTAKQHVTFDYAERLAKGFDECDKVVAQGLDSLLLKTSTDQAPPKAQYIF